MPGMLETNEEVVKVVDPTCCRVYAGRPMGEVGDDLTLLNIQLRMKWTGRTPVWAYVGKGDP
jgi:hypothetical protein